MTAAGQPRTAVVVGGGIVGLSVAWFLQEHGVEVTVVERSEVGAGASWGNAGWISPGLAIPLPEPSVLRYGFRSLMDPDAPLYVPTKPDPKLWAFLTRFAAHCTMPQWRKAMRHYLPVNAGALDAFDVLTNNGVAAKTVDAPIMAAFERAEQAADLRHELELINQAGQEINFTELSGAEVRKAVPQVSGNVELALRLDGQRYIDPGAFTQALADAVRERGGEIRTGFTARTLRHGPKGVTVEAYAGDPVHADTVVLATGSWLDELAKPLGVKMPVRAGRGYSFSVPVTEDVPCPVYFPAVRVACTPYQGRLRVAGTMEFRHADAPLDPRRVTSIVNSARKLLTGVDWTEQAETWVGPRPVTPDGLPLIGETKVPGVYVAGGHGMWGVTLGPLTGQLLAEQMVTGKAPAALHPFNPHRGGLRSLVRRSA
ncbi:FAD-binding oxidoreductase [Allokutzneria sp. NRRL B-24872]|uniref:NAD(P)/FAD-dependent oxidoreductase n=1 Tax=Allokutzneria sp. NRRL B-24872 TaxID=1137961 RepID=UPI000A378AC8|nr:FAD-dependent oxidoreductase [Allokutzneria sp. NRRL B-24872]